MSRRGFSLIELLTVIALIGILSALGTFAFSQYAVKSRISSQTRLLYGDLMEYRTKALYEKKRWTFKISATGYGIYSSTNTTVAPVKSIALRYGITSDTADDVTFDSNGLIHFSSDISDLTLTKSACVAAANDAVVDSVVITATRVQVGKKTGVDCVAAAITPH
jgi:prepilin-type N-terminal cleavage/methylation domain-containing protein